MFCEILFLLTIFTVEVMRPVIFTESSRTITVRTMSTSRKEKPSQDDTNNQKSILSWYFCVQMQFMMLVFYALESPHDHISLTPRVIMPVCVERFPILFVRSTGQELRHGRLQLFEEN